MASGGIDPRRHKFSLSVEFLKVYVRKNVEATILFVDFYKSFDSKHKGKMEQILIVYSLPKETVVAIMMLYRNTKDRSLDGDRLLRHCSRCTTKRHIAPYLWTICLDYVLRTSIDKMKENGLKLTKEWSRRCPSKTITDAVTTDDIALPANASAQAETLLHSLERHLQA